jgi:peptide/nickel transport system permease protein
MLHYIIRRILLFVPSVFLITLAAFIINSASPGDPVMRLLGAENDQQGSPVMYEQQYSTLQHQMGLDLPLFYITLSNAAYPKELYKVHNSQHRKMIVALSLESGYPEGVMHYYSAAVNYINTHNDEAAAKLRSTLYVSSVAEMEKIFRSIRYQANPSKELLPVINASNEHFIDGWPQPYQKYIPVLRWNSYNQYHRWLFGDRDHPEIFKGIFRGDFGKSYITGKSITTIIKERLGWTLFFTLGGILISLLIAIPMGIYTAAKADSRFDKRSSKFFLLLHSLPSFFTATLLLMIFANPSVLGWFPASGVAPVSSAEGDLHSITKHLPYIVLPLTCYALASLPFLARTVRSSMIGELHKDYIVTARAKGLEEKNVLWQHAFRNSFFPLITLTAWLFPAMIGGSAILETVFSIPGMGLEIVQSVYNRDYPMLIAVFTLTGLLTVTGYLVSDLLYTVADPRVRLK